MKPVNGSTRFWDLVAVASMALVTWSFLILFSFKLLFIYAVLAVVLLVRIAHPEFRSAVVNNVFGLQLGLLLHSLFSWTLGGENLVWWFGQTVSGSGFGWLVHDFSDATAGWFRILIALVVLPLGIVSSIYKNQVAWWGMPLLVGSIRWRKQSGEGWHIKLPFWLERIARHDGALIQARQLADDKMRESMANDGSFEAAPVPTRGFPGVALSGDESGNAFDEGTGPEVTPILELFLRRVNLSVLLATEVAIQKFPAGAVLNMIQRRFRDFGGVIPYSIFLDLTNDQFTWLSMDDLRKIDKKIADRDLDRKGRYRMWKDELAKAVKRKKPAKAPKWMKVSAFDSMTIWQQIQFIEAKKANGDYVHAGSLQFDIYMTLGMFADVQIKDMEQQPDIKKAQENLADALIEITEQAARGKAKGAAVWAQAAELLGVDPKDPDVEELVKERAREVFDTERAIEALAGNKALVVPGQIPNMLRGLLKDASS